MIIRPCKRQDLPAVQVLWNDTIEQTLITFTAEHKTLEGLTALLDVRRAAGHGFFVAEVDGDVAGFATYGQFRGGDGYARTMEHSISLSNAVRGRGVGRALMGDMEAHAAVAGVHSMWAGVSGANPAGRDFHAALGYREIATLPEVGHKWGQWLDLTLRQKVLSPSLQRG